MGMTRRQLLAGSLGAGLLALARPRSALALGPQQLVTALRLRHAGHWDSNPGALGCLLEEMRLRTSTDTAEDELVALAVDIDACAGGLPPKLRFLPVHVISDRATREATLRHIRDDCPRSTSLFICRRT